MPRTIPLLAWGERGEWALRKLLGIRPVVFVPLFATIVVLFLAAVHFYTAR